MTEDPKLLLTNALSNLAAALESISSKCTEACPELCTEVAHADSEPDCESAADEILEAQRRIQEFLNAFNCKCALGPAKFMCACGRRYEVKDATNIMCTAPDRKEVQKYTEVKG